jgi:hypothetical protein
MSLLEIARYIFPIHEPIMAKPSENITMEMLSPKRLQEWQPIRAKELNHTLSSIFERSEKHPDSPLEVKDKLWVLTTNITSMMLVSKRYFLDEDEEESEEAKEFKYVMEEMLHLVGSIFPADCLPFLKWFDLGGFEKRTRALYPRFQNILTKILSERRAQRKQAGEGYVDVDLVDVLLTHEERGGDVPVTEGNIRGVVWVNPLEHFRLHSRSLVKSHACEVSFHNLMSMWTCAGCVCGRHRHAANRDGVGDGTPVEGPGLDGDGEIRAGQSGGGATESGGERHC